MVFSFRHCTDEREARESTNGAEVLGYWVLAMFRMDRTPRNLRRPP